MKKTLFLMIAVLLLSLTFAGIESAQAAIKWSQPLDQIAGQTYNGQPVYNGWDQPSWFSNPWNPSNPQVADDWLSTDNRPITNIRWWGSFENYAYSSQDPTHLPQFPSAFWFGIYHDVPADTTAGFSRPGELIWAQNTLSLGWVTGPWGYEWDPRTQLITDSTWTFVMLGVGLPEASWFYPAANSIYWLSIVALYTTPPVEHEFGWATRPHYFMDDAVTRNTSGGWDRVGYWKQVFMGTHYESQFESWDMAFELYTVSTVVVPEPSSLLALAAGFTALAGMAIRKRSRA